MKATGIVRRIDDLGRIVIPKEIRREFRIREGESLEIFVDNDNIVLRKHSPMEQLKEFASKYIDSIYPMIKQNILITDRDSIIAGAGPLKSKYFEKYISEYLENLLLRRDAFVERHIKEIEISPNIKEEGIYSISPIIVNGDAIGLVIIFSSTDDNLTFIDEKVTDIMANFLSKHIEG
jgi:AbrB family transcriptional regulator (stage V sporulation protein T)